MISDPFYRFLWEFRQCPDSLGLVSSCRFTHLNSDTFSAKPIQWNCFESRISGFEVWENQYIKNDLNVWWCWVCLRALAAFAEPMAHTQTHTFDNLVCVCNNHLTENSCNPCENNSSSCVVNVLQVRTFHRRIRIYFGAYPMVHRLHTYTSVLTSYYHHRLPLQYPFILWKN